LKRRRLWKDIQTVGMIYRHREVDGVSSESVTGRPPLAIR